jgi:hypothetical protein
MKNTPVNSPLRNWKLVSGAAMLGLCLTAIGCGVADLPPGQTQKGNPVPTGPFTLTVATVDTPAEVDFTDNTGATVGSITGTSTFTLSYAAGAQVVLNAPNFSNLEIFQKWIGCQASVGPSCVLTATSSTTVTAVYVPQVSFTLQPQVGGPNGCCTPPYYLLIGQVEQIYLHPTFLNNQTNGNVTWSVVSSDPAFSPGTIDSGGNYVPPYPAPPFVTITAVSQFDPLSTVSVVINLGTPTTLPGPALTVDTSAVTHAISPLIYGVNLLDNNGATTVGNLAPTMDRWGGDAATRYNYLLDVYNSASDYYFETNPNSNTAYPDTSVVNSQIALDEAAKATSVVTMPLIGYTTQSSDATKRAFACGFSIAKYGVQQSSDQYHTDCGNGETSSGYPPINWGAPVQVGAFTVGTGPKRVTNPADTSVQIDASYTTTPGTNTAAVDASFTTGWVNYLVGKFGNAASGGVGIYELDNEPEYWSGVHQDVHPFWMTYDELTNKGIGYAKAIKTADPTAQVSGPVISSYQNYFYSTADEWAGYNFGDSGDNYCYCYNSNPADRVAHGNVPLLAYYLQQMSAASATAGVRLLDYVDVHAYFSAPGTANSPVGNPGNTTVQTAREFSTRFLWDPTYIDPNGTTDPEQIANNSPKIAIQLIPFLQGLVTANYPGTKTAITEYNFGGEDSISGAITEAEALAVFGWQGLDMASLWSEPLAITDPKYLPTQTAFNFFLNYDGAGSKFGDGSLATSSADPTQLTIYAAKRSSDGKTTVIVFNKTYQDETSSLTLTTTATTAKVFQYDVADLTKITSGSTAAVTSGAVTVTFPAQSITLLEF